MISRAAIFSSSMARQTLMRSAAAGSSCDLLASAGDAHELFDGERRAVQGDGHRCVSSQELQAPPAAQKAAATPWLTTRHCRGGGAGCPDALGSCPGLRTQIRRASTEDRPRRRPRPAGAMLLSPASGRTMRALAVASSTTYAAADLPPGRSPDVRPADGRHAWVPPVQHRTRCASVRSHAGQHQLRLPRPVARVRAPASLIASGARPIPRSRRRARPLWRALAGAFQGDSTWRTR